MRRRHGRGEQRPYASRDVGFLDLDERCDRAEGLSEVDLCDPPEEMRTLGGGTTRGVGLLGLPDRDDPNGADLLSRVRLLRLSDPRRGVNPLGAIGLLSLLNGAGPMGCDRAGGVRLAGL